MIKESLATIEFNKESVELLKVILEQNRLILVTNQMLAEYLAKPPIILRAGE